MLSHLEKILRLAITILLLYFVGYQTHASEIYKYKDAQGKWIFTDKKPQAENVEKVAYKTQKKSTTQPELFIEKINNRYLLQIHNPLHAPVEIQTKSTRPNVKNIHQVVAANSQTTLLTSDSPIEDIQFRWTLGEPTLPTDIYSYRFPVQSKSAFTISQGFSGQFSHTREPNVYAVDIAMQVGTHISAARAGTVISVRDDYHMGGRESYFLDKANYVMVLHEDGTYAVYAHIMLGGALVQAGDKIAAGDLLARSGSSGFSTGPHLHFVIRHNLGMKTRSVPFHFIDGDGKTFQPTRGLSLVGN